MDPPLSNGLAYMISDTALKAHLAECVSKGLTSEVCSSMVKVPHVVSDLICSLDQYMRVDLPRCEPGSHKVLSRVLCNGCGCCRLRATWLQTPKWCRRPPEGRTVIRSNLSSVFAHSSCYSRYTNMDFALLSTLLPSLNDGISRVLVSYDIGCQWVKNLQSRICNYSISASLNLSSLLYWRVVVPKFHLSGHGESCQVTYNLNYTKGVGCMDGERIESGWSLSGSMAVWTRENGPNARRAILDDHWESINWQKLLGLRTYA